MVDSPEEYLIGNNIRQEAEVQSDAINIFN